MKHCIRLLFLVILITLLLSACKTNENINITLELNGGKGDSSYVLSTEDTYDKLPAPTRFGYSFGGWYTDRALTIGVKTDEKVQDVSTLYASWIINTYIVNFDLRYDTTPIDPILINYLESLTPTEVNRSGYNLSGWYLDSELTTPFNSNIPVTSDMTLYAKWMKNYYNIVFDINTGGVSPESQSILYEEKAEEPATPTRVGWNFLGWYVDYNTIFNFNTPITHNYLLYARWEQTIYYVYFNTDGGNHIETQELNYPEKAIMPTDPIKTGYEFDGWYSDSELTTLYDFNDRVTDDVTLYAKWKTDFLYTAVGNNITITGLREGLVINDLQIPEIYANMTVTAIETGAFSDRDDIITVTIPRSVISIGEGAFSNCPNILSFSVDNRNSKYFTINNALFYYNSRLFSIYTATLIQYPLANEATTFTLNNYIIGIGLSACEGAVSLETISISSTVTTINDYAFKDCTSLISCNLPITTVNVGVGVFMNCISLPTITLSNAMPFISESMFLNCTALQSITLPVATLTIGNSAFSNCTSLVTVNFNTILQFIDTSAFDNCTALSAIALPNSINLVGVGIFNNCTSLETVTIGSSLNALGISMFSNCTKLSNIIIPSTVTSIGELIFNNCSALTEIVLPDGITEIPISAFMGCNGLISVTLGNYVTSIGATAFSGCSSLVSIILPSTITSIGIGAFYDCTSLLYVIILAMTAPDIILSFTYNTTIYYPEEATGYNSLYWYIYDMNEGIPV